MDDERDEPAQEQASPRSKKEHEQKTKKKTSSSNVHVRSMEKRKGSGSSNPPEFDLSNVELSKPFNVEKLVSVNITENGFDGLPEEYAEQLSEYESSFTLPTHNMPQEDKVFSIDEVLNKDNPEDIYASLRIIGQGSFGDIFYAINKFTSQKVAIKKLEVELNDTIVDRYLREITLLKQLKHPNIINYLDTFYLQNKLWIVMEYMNKGCLGDLLETYPTSGRMTEDKIAYVLRETVSALKYLHSMYCIHRDVKSDNILVGENGEIKLGDFGLACRLTAQKAHRSDPKVGTPHWMSPECIIGEYDWKTDIWSLGVFCYELMLGEPPLSQFSPEEAIQEITKSGLPLASILSSDQKWSPSLLNFLNQCMERNPARRPSASTLLQHPFFKTACTAKEFALFVNKRSTKN